MITLPEALEKFMQGQDLTGLKPFALLYRNKWVEEESGSGDEGHYELDTTPIDITDMIVKPNMLSMTLDVNEVAQYNCNNVTLTLADTKNKLIEGVPSGYFPDGYQLYGSKVVLFYGLNNPINPYRTQVGYTVVGSPTISNGVASGFSNSNYVSIPAITFNGNDFESVTHYSYKENATIYRIPILGKFGTTQWQAFFNNSGNLRFYVGGTQYTPSLNGKNFNFIKFKKTGNNLIISQSNDGTSWTNETTYQNLSWPSTSISNDLGKCGQSETVEASIDFNKTYIKVNGEYWFNGAYFFYEQQNTRLFTGMIKDLPTHKPEQYQVELKLVSPLEMLKDIEAKDFSTKVTGETLTYKSTDSDGHRIYWTTGLGVGGFDGVYADGTKLFEGVDYELEQISSLNHPAIVTIINSTYYSSTITADYYTWKTQLTVEEIVAGLGALAGYDSTNTDISNVIWNTGVRNPDVRAGVFAAIGYYQGTEYEYKYNWKPTRGGTWQSTNAGSRKHIYPSNFDFSFQLTQSVSGSSFFQIYTATTTLAMGDTYNSSNVSDSGTNIGIVGVKNGLSVRICTGTRRGPDDEHGQATYIRNCYIYVHKISNGSATQLYKGTFTQASTFNSGTIKVSKRGNTVTVYRNNTQIATTTISTSMNYEWQGRYKTSNFTMENDYAKNQAWNIYDNNMVTLATNIKNPCVVSTVNDKTALGDTWYAVKGTLSGSSDNYFLNCYFSDDASTWSAPLAWSLNTAIGRTERYLYFVLGINNAPSANFNIEDLMTQFISQKLVLDLVNLGNSTVLEALQDFALISGYEFGVDRHGVFFFRPRVASTTPIFTLGHDEIVKVDTVKRNFSDFFTKLTLTFAQRPLEFYANTGERPTAVDKYGIINKEIDKPDIVNYDNPELAQAIGPQLLEVYADLSNIIQAVGKINLSLELGDIVSLQRNMNLVQPDDASEYSKFINSDIYFRACKITGMNYNFAKNQITYTLRDVSNESNSPTKDGELYEFVYDLPIQLGAK